MVKILNYFKYSGVWVGFVLNPFHWQFGHKTNLNEFPACDYLFENCVHFGPIWIRVIIDDGSW